MHRKIFMLIIWLLFVIHCLLFFTLLIVPTWLLTVLFDKNLRILHRLSVWWALSYIYWNPFWKVTLLGEENLQKGRPYVVVVNHQSSLDIPLLYRLPLQYRWVAKAELYRVPFVGWNLYLNRHIVIARGNAISARHMVGKCLNSLKNGVSVLIFPEGTRSKTGRIGRFKEGAFMIAREVNAPILPVLIDGTFDAFSRDGSIANVRQHFIISILPPVEQEALVGKSNAEVAAMLQQEMVAQHKLVRPELYT